MTIINTRAHNNLNHFTQARDEYSFIVSKREMNINVLTIKIVKHLLCGRILSEKKKNMEENHNIIFLWHIEVADKAYITVLEIFLRTQVGNCYFLFLWDIVQFDFNGLYHFPVRLPHIRTFYLIYKIMVLHIII